MVTWEVSVSPTPVLVAVLRVKAAAGFKSTQSFSEFPRCLSNGQFTPLDRPGSHNCLIRNEMSGKWQLLSRCRSSQNRVVNRLVPVVRSQWETVCQVVGKMPEILRAVISSPMAILASASIVKPPDGFVGTDGTCQPDR